VTDRHEGAPESDPLRFPDGRPKSSPDDTSLLGLAAVWSEIDEPMPPKRSAGKGGTHQRGRSRQTRRARRARPAQSPGVRVMLGLAAAVVLALAVIVFLVIQLS
jgi:hypothetical protein